eukprot:TRINITY_DN4350_c0_g1_i1.p1 TRINITY_DN4350_c0_g1~~TRINITY_DN4350_c0_g1_i1.p1  ORF type:complete len:382 (+),score=46.61 TRINITY_DN4350_c0_g1_i1:90-1235(+)
MGEESDPLEGSYYSVLGLDLAATPNEIKSAYHREARQHHPDRCEGETEKFKCVQEAYETLKNKETKRVYDKSLKIKRPAAKRKERVHLIPRSAVRSPIVVTCVGNKKRTLDTHESCFMMPLRHGDVIQSSTGAVGTILGMFDGEVFWVPSGSEEAQSFGHREELNNPGVATTRWKVLKNGGRRRVSSQRAPQNQAAPTLRGMGRLGRRTIIKRQSSALVDRRKMCSKEKSDREDIENDYLKICNEIHLTFDSERSVMFRRTQSRGLVKPLNMAGIRTSYNGSGIPSPRYYRPSTQTFTFPSNTTATTCSPRRRLRRTASATFSQPPAHEPLHCGGASTPRGRKSDLSSSRVNISRSSSRSRLIRRGVTLRACTPGIDVRLL